MNGPYTIFYSWQSDKPDAVCRKFIREALNMAARRLLNEASVEESPRVDSGMEGVSGTPEVATVMFDKIQESSIFVADMTLTGCIPILGENQVKKVSNPNVTLELGYAAGVLGWDRIICVMNEHYGLRMEQTFDVRNRRFPINYSLAPEMTDMEQEVKHKLAETFFQALITTEKNELRKVEVALKLLDRSCLQVMHAFKHADYFSETVTTSDPYHLYNEIIMSAAPRLLDLGLIYSHADFQQGLYAYHWTYLGKKVAEKATSHPTLPWL